MSSDLSGVLGLPMMGAVSAAFPLPIHLHNPATITKNSRPRAFPLHRSPIRNPNSLGGSIVFAGGNGLSRDEAEEEEEAGGGGRDDLKRDRRTPAFNIRWRDLLNPDPENLLSVGLAGLLTWASVQVLWQLFVISIAILLAALKYSFIAALLLFILITLL